MPKKRNAEVSSNHRSGPLHVRRPAVPRWEKLFCSSVSSITWERIVETKKYMCKYNNIVNWDDSAAKEAFDNAKSRFWADINGLPCNIPFPDPDMYIDDIDWNSSVDPELLLDLDNVTTFPSQQESNKGVVIFGDAPLLEQSIPCSEWDEPEKDALKPAEFVSGAQVNLHENKNVTPREQDDTPYYAAKESEWQKEEKHSHIGGSWNKRKSYGDRRKEESMARGK